MPQALLSIRTFSGFDSKTPCSKHPKWEKNNNSEYSVNLWIHDLQIFSQDVPLAISRKKCICGNSWTVILHSARENFIVYIKGEKGTITLERSPISPGNLRGSSVDSAAPCKASLRSSLLFIPDGWNTWRDNSFWFPMDTNFNYFLCSCDTRLSRNINHVKAITHA